MTTINTELSDARRLVTALEQLIGDEPSDENESLRIIAFTIGDKLDAAIEILETPETLPCK